MAELKINGVPIQDDYSETFSARMARILVTSCNRKWALEAALETKGLGRSATPPCEATLEREVSPDESPDGRPGFIIQVMDRKLEHLQKCLALRIRKGAVPNPKTSVFDALPREMAEEFVMSHLKVSATEIPRRCHWQVVSICLLGAASLSACAHSAPINTGIDIHHTAEDSVRPQRVGLIVFETHRTEGHRDLCRWSQSLGEFRCDPEKRAWSSFGFGSPDWVPQKALSKALRVDLISARDLNNSDVEEWYARYGRQYARSVDVIIQGVDGEGSGEAIEFLGQVYRADHLLVTERVSRFLMRTLDSDVGLKADLYRVDSKQRVWSATVYADIGATDQRPDRCQREDAAWDITCWFWSGSVRPDDEAIWKAIAKELAASFPDGQTSKR